MSCLTEQYNTKRESMKDYQCFFYLLDNHQLKNVTNVQITIQWYQIIIASLQEGTLVPVTHIGQSHPTKTFNGSHGCNLYVSNISLSIYIYNSFYCLPFVTPQNEKFLNFYSID